MDKLYRNNMKNREFGKEAPQNFCQERAPIDEGQGASEGKNFEIKPTLPKTDSSCCFGVKVLVLAEEESHIPIYASEEAAGADIKAFISQEKILEPGESILIPTGLRMAIPKGYEIQIRPRSGLALKHQVTVLNTPGTIDADYRGEIGVILINHGRKPFVITPGMRIAQMVLAPVVRAEFRKEEFLVTTSRGEGGFGHTGTH